MVGAWLNLIVKSAVVAAVVAAAQLGAGDALGVISWVGPHDDRAWTTLLTWVAFAYAVAVLAGALAGRMSVQRVRGSDGIGVRVVASVIAAVGAGTVIGLAWLSAREVRPPVNANPGLVISITAGAGVLVGLVLAVLALSTRSVAAGVWATVAWVWLVAVGAAVVGLTSNEPYPAPRLAVPDAPSLITPSAWTGPRTMVMVSGALGLVVAAVARGRGASRLGASIAGLGGPALVAAAYLIAGPGEDQSEAYLAALLAVAVGLAASAVVAIPGRAPGSAKASQPARSKATASDQTTGPAPAAEASTVPGHETPPGDVLVSARAPVTTSAPGPSRPAWAEGSGPVARAYTSGGSSHAGATATATAPHGSGWNADTLTGQSHDERPSSGGGLYRSNSYGDSYESVTTTRPAVAAAMGQPSDPHESWLRDLGSPGRHSAAD